MFFRSREQLKNVDNKIVEYILHSIVHNGSDFDCYVVLKNLLQWPSVFNLLKNGAGIVSLKIFNGFVDDKKKYPNISISGVGEFILIVI